jgi:hypothetical protein
VLLGEEASEYRSAVADLHVHLDNMGLAAISPPLHAVENMTKKDHN